MGRSILQASIWELAARQHGVVARRQLLELGFTPAAIDHRIETGRLHRARRGVYAVGRPELSQMGLWMGAVLACGPGAVLSHVTAAALWGIRDQPRGPIHVTVPGSRNRVRPGIVVHRRRVLSEPDTCCRHGVPVTRPASTLVDLAGQLNTRQLEAAVNQADKLGLIDPEALRDTIAGFGPRDGIATLRRLLDRHSFVLTDSELERRFLPIVRSAGLPVPETGRRVNGFKVDFFWRALGLVVETDGLRYHRTPSAQARDRLRDQRHAAAGLATLRFTHAQVSFEPAYVRATLRAVAGRRRDR